MTSRPRRASISRASLRLHLSRLERRTLVIVFAAAALAVGAAILLGDRAGWDRVLDALGRVHPVWFAVCFGGEVLAYLGYILAVRDTARVDGGPDLGLSLSTRMVVAGFGVFAATRASGGFVVDYWALRRAGEGRERAIARVLGLGALEYAVLASAALLSALVLLLGQGGHVPQVVTLPWLLVIPGFFVALWATAPRRGRRLSNPRGGGRLRRAVAHAVAGVVVLRRIATRPLHHRLGLLGVSLYWFGDIVVLWAALRVFNAHLSLSIPALVIGYATGYVLTRRSLPAGGAGVVEVLLTFALTWVGLPFVPALLGVVAYRIFNFWLPILPALALLPTVRQLRGELQEAEREWDPERAGRVR